MNALSANEFADAVMAMAREAPPFKPSAYYDKDGDCIEFIAKPDPFYAERVDDLLTVYYSHESGDIIGSLIKGVGKLLDKFPGLYIEVQDHRIRLQHLFRAKLWCEFKPEDIRIWQYQKLIQMAEETHAEAELACA